MSPFYGLMKQWLINAEAAELLGVDSRTVKRWMRRPDLRNAISAVRHGRQWRIPRPADFRVWKWETRSRLRQAGVDLQGRLMQQAEHELKKRSAEYGRYAFEVRRFFVAACWTALARGRLTRKAGNGIRILCQAACEILDTLAPEQIDVHKLKPKFAAWARSWARQHADELKRPGTEWPSRLMRYWPSEKGFLMVRGTNSLHDLEPVRQSLDLTQAARDVKRHDKELTGANLHRLVHQDLMTHINDTREELPTCRVIDFRKPQGGLSLRAFRDRHPLRKPRQQRILAMVRRCGSESGDQQPPHSAKTPPRGPEDD